MIVLEKWVPNKPISAIYFDGEKANYYIKRFMIDNPNKDESFISEHPKSQLEVVATDFRPMAEIVFSKRSLDKMEINLEEFIAVKGIKSLGNKLTSEKIRQVNLLESLEYIAPEIEEVEVVEEELVETLSLDIPVIEKEVKLKVEENPIEEEKKATIVDANKKIPVIKPPKKKIKDDDQTSLF